MLVETLLDIGIENAPALTRSQQIEALERAAADARLDPQAIALLRELGILSSRRD